MDSIFSARLDNELQGFGVCVLKTPVRAPKANAYCERLVGTLRRECLDFLIPLTEVRLKRILREFVRPLQSRMRLPNGRTLYALYAAPLLKSRGS